jgi:hypothetical protein
MQGGKWLASTYINDAKFDIIQRLKTWIIFNICFLVKSLPFKALNNVMLVGEVLPFKA